MDGEDFLIDEGTGEQLLLEPGPRVVTEAEIRAAILPELEQWKLAAEKELHESFYRTEAVSITTAQELAAFGGRSRVLPMKAVWTRKANGIYKCRGCVCGNFVTKDPTEQAWTAQSETSSVLAGLRLAQIRNLAISKHDVERIGGAWNAVDTEACSLWTAVRPAGMGLARDMRLKGARWKAHDQIHTLDQSKSDSQVWWIVEEGGVQRWDFLYAVSMTSC